MEEMKAFQSPKVTTNNYYQPKYKSQVEEEKRLRQQYMEYTNKLEMDIMRNTRHRVNPEEVEGESIELKKQTRLEQLKCQAERIKVYIESMKDNVALNFTMQLQDRKKSIEFENRSAEKKYSQ